MTSISYCVSASDGQSPDEALDDLFNVLQANGNYADHLTPKRPCVRIAYADDYIGGFHVDVVPIRVSDDPVAPLDAPRRQAGWHPTAPAEYTDWCAQQGDLFRRTAQMLKRWRDEHQEVRAAIKSIVLQVLISEHMPQHVTGDAIRTTETILGLRSAVRDLTAAPAVHDPVLPSENLTARWEATAFTNFKKELSEAANIVQTASQSDDPVEAAEKWRELFGDAFPLPRKSLFGVRLADTSHARRPVTQGWYEAYDDRYRLTITATERRGKKGKASPYEDDGPLLFAGAGKRLRFTAHHNGLPTSAEIWWRVTNTGAHARQVKELRGDFFKARRPNGSPSPNPLENWESSAFTGTHLIEVFAVVGARVVAKSQPFKVNIYKKGRSWAW